MRVYSFKHNQQPKLGAEFKGQLIDLAVAYEAIRDPEHLQQRLPQIPADLLSLVRMGELGKAAITEAFTFASKRRAIPVGEQLLHPLDSVIIRVPIRRPGKILCFDSGAVGFHENRGVRCIVKFASALIGPDEFICKPRNVVQIRSRPHLAALIGRKMRNVSTKDALEDVFGITLLNDISACDPSFGIEQSIIAHNFDTFCPIGPCVVTPEEIMERGSAAGRMRKNGEEIGTFEVQSCVDRLKSTLSLLSTTMTFEPGDIVATPLSETAAMILEPGERISIAIDGIATLENPIALEESPSTTRKLG